MEIEERINQLEDLRQRTWHAGKNFLADLPGDSAEWSEVQRSTWQKYNDDVDRYAADIAGLKAQRAQQQGDDTLREAERQVFGDKGFVQREAETAANFRSWLRQETVMRSIDHDGQPFNGLSVNIRAAWRERDLLRQGASWDEVRDLAWDATSGSLTVPTTLARALYQKLEASIALFKLPVTRINTETGNPWSFDRIDAHAVATQAAGQGSTVAVGTDPVFGKLDLTPAKYVEMIKLASELITDNEVGVEEIMGAEIGRALGRVVDSVEIPKMLPATTLGSVNTGGSLIGPTYDKVIDLEFAVNDEYRNGGSAAWLWNDRTVAALRKIRDGAGGTEGMPLWNPGIQGGLSIGQPPTFDTYPLFTDPNVASMASNARIGAFGDWRGYFFRSVGSVLIDRDASRYFDTDQIAFRGKWRAIGGYQDTTAVYLMKQNV